ncbi:hypothetical protein [Nocardia sp. NPDC046763]|uniref:hypothetical protein n=1 Tax=Nocardia sp. NPDC046763 TaxID=3155256 RepID=UPI00340B5301
MSVDIAAVRAELELLAGEFMATSAEVRDGLKEAAEHGAEIGRGIAEAELTHSRRHVTKGGYVNEPGDYARAFRGERVFVNGAWHGRVVNDDWKCWWIEDGTEKWPKHAIMLRTAAQMRGNDTD